MDNKISREEFEELLLKLQNIKIYYDEDEEASEAGNVLDELYNKYSAKTITLGNKIEKHRAYILEETVLQVGRWFIGMWGIGTLKSEWSRFEDIDIHVKFYEMESFITTGYKRKQGGEKPCKK